MYLACCEQGQAYSDVARAWNHVCQRLQPLEATTTCTCQHVHVPRSAGTAAAASPCRYCPAAREPTAAPREARAQAC